MRQPAPGAVCDASRATASRPTRTGIDEPLVESLADPVIHPAPQGGVMVEYRLEDDRLGYLPVSLTADGSAVLKT